VVEYDNLCKKILKIVPNLLKKCKFACAGTIEDRARKYIQASNPFGLFVELCCRKGEGLWIPYEELFNAYVQYLIKNKRRRVTRAEFKQAMDLEGLYSIKTSKLDNSEQRINGHFVENLTVYPDYMIKIENDLKLKK
jgi:hypothetical protein